MEATPTHVQHIRIFSMVLMLSAVFTWASCVAPVKSKRQSLQRVEAQRSYSDKPVRGGGDVHVYTDTVPTLERKRILPLREEIERMQVEQRALASRVDSIQDQVRVVQTSLQSLQQNGAQRYSPNSNSYSPSGSLPSQSPRSSTVPGGPQESTKQTLPALSQKGSMEQPSMVRQQETRPTPGDASHADIEVIQPDQEDSRDEIPPIRRKATVRRRNYSQIPKPLVAPRTAPAAETTIPRQSPSRNTIVEQPAAAGNRSGTAGSMASGATSVSAPEAEVISFTKAMDLFKRKQFQECISVLSALNSKSASTEGIAKNNYWIGESHFGLARYDEAIRSFKKTLSFSSSEKSAAAQFMIAESYLKMGRNDEAKRGYERVAKLYPQSAEAVRALKRLQQI